MKILIATDGSDASKSVIETACKIISKPEETFVKIISAVESMAPMTAEPFAVSAEYYAEMEVEAANHAKGFVEQSEADLKEICPNLREVSTQVFRGNAAQTIVESAEEWNADLIIVGSHGYGFWQRALLGSISNSVVHHAPCSVLIVRQKK